MNEKIRWCTISLLGLAAFNWPLLMLFGQNEIMYLFMTWLAVICLSGLASCLSGRPGNGREESP